LIQGALAIFAACAPQDNIDLPCIPVSRFVPFSKTGPSLIVRPEAA